MYYLLLPSLEARTRFIAALRERDILSVFHYVPLHSSPAGRRYGRAAGTLPHTEALSDRLVRLPMFNDLADQQEQVIQATLQICQDFAPKISSVLAA
jgi:dTDP-4-amino-4,6-dideoxygalactose transaminase